MRGRRVREHAHRRQAHVLHRRHNLTVAALALTLATAVRAAASLGGAHDAHERGQRHRARERPVVLLHPDVRRRSRAQRRAHREAEAQAGRGLDERHAGVGRARRRQGDVVLWHFGGAVLCLAVLYYEDVRGVPFYRGSFGVPFAQHEGLDVALVGLDGARAGGGDLALFEAVAGRDAVVGVEDYDDAAGEERWAVKPERVQDLGDEVCGGRGGGW